jgi:polysaccharide pyruvyl transferase WcaK-like protein
MGAIRDLPGRVRRRLLATEPMLRLSAATAFRGFGQARGEASGSLQNIVIAGPGQGSVGDQAMLDAFIENVDDPITVVVRRPEDLLFEPSPRIRILALPDLLYGHGRQHRRDVRILSEECSRARSLSVIGADVMDGAYSVPASVRRFEIPLAAANAGLDARVLGFSWNESPAPAARRAMRRASRRATLLARDPVSAKRLRNDGAAVVQEAADLAFLTTPSTDLAEDAARWLESLPAGRSVAIVNINHGLQKKWGDQLPAYRGLVERALELGVAVLLLPNDSRGQHSDERLLATLAESFAGEPAVHLIPRVVPPGQVAALASRAAFAVSGRMHVVVMAASAGTPSIALSYQGKVAGLYELLGLTSYVAGGPELAADLIAALESMVDELEDNRETLAAALPGIRELSMRNLAGLTAAGLTAAADSPARD